MRCLTNKHLLLHNELQFLTESEANVCSSNLENLGKTPHVMDMAPNEGP